MKLKNYFQIGIGAGLVMALGGSIFWIKSGYSKAPEVAPVEEPADPNDVGPDSRLEEDIAARNAAAIPASSEGAKTKMVIDLNKASESFAQGVKQLAACLNVAVEPTESLDPSYENLLKTVKQSYGEPIMNSEDWIVWNLRAGGEDRRIRIETDYSDSNASTRNLLYFKIDSQGTPALIPLPPEQTKNPTEAFIASLQKDGEVYQEEKGLRGYFERGQELTATERDGKVDDFVVTSGTKTFRCTGVLTTATVCKCN